MTAALTALPWVKITLDTTPPVVVVDAPGLVEAGQDWVVRLQANEDLGPCTATYLDAAGVLHSVGLARTGPRSLLATVPTERLLSGTLIVQVRDLACNPTTVIVPVRVLRPDPYDATLTITHPLEVALTVDHPFEGTVEISHPLDAALTQDHPFEAVIEVGHPLDADLEFTDGQ